jgi:hypothetical protein
MCAPCESDSPLRLQEERWEAGWHTLRHTYRSWLDDTGAACGSAAKTHAARPSLDHDERVWQCADGSKARGPTPRCQEAIEERTAMKGTLQPNQKLHGVFARCCLGYLGLANRLRGRGGRI